jgi:hypothetical protein
MKNITPVLEGVYADSELRKTIAPLFIGNPGLGKTHLIEDFAKSVNANLIELITSQMSPFEVSGIMMPDKETQKMICYNYDKLASLKDGDILFFDELLNGNPTVLNACLTVIEQRTLISGDPLPDIMIVAAANPQGMSPLTPQIKERFVWYDVVFDSPMYKEFMFNKYRMPPNITDTLSSLIKEEKFEARNFNTSRSLDKAVNMIIKGVPTPYENILLPTLNFMVENTKPEKVQLAPELFLEPGENISWLKLKQHQYEATKK